MAVPEGEITTSEIYVEDTEPATEEENALAEATLKAMGIEEVADEATN